MIVHRMRVLASCLAMLTLVVAQSGQVRAASQTSEETPAELDERIAALIEDLGSGQYVVRQRAESQLKRLGPVAFDALKEAEQHPDVEVASRATYLAQLIEVEWARESDPPEVREILGDYGSQEDDERLERIKRLAVLSNDLGLKGLCRIIRFESDPNISRRAAVALLSTREAGEESWADREAAVNVALGNSRRAAANWIRTAVTESHDVEAALARWQEHIKAEQDLLTTNPQETGSAILVALMRRHIKLLRDAGHRHEAVAATMRMIELETGDSETLSELVEWLAEEKDWAAIDRVAERFKAKFDVQPYLLYVLAEARHQQGQSDRAEEIAQRALALSADDGREHLRVAMLLRNSGLFRWARDEFVYAFQLGPAESPIAVLAARSCSEMLHDQNQEADAADVLGKLVKEMEDDTVENVVRDFGLEPGSVRSRLEYFRANAAKAANDMKAYRKHLDLAIGHDPEDADVLIAMYRIEDAEDEYREKTAQLIHEATRQFQQYIDDNPEEAIFYNQYAWLVGNTMGDKQLAIDYSHRSLELRPASAAFLDTLAHCYYEVGDFANAVRYQQQAALLEPHSGLLSRQLKVFQTALEESEK